MALPASLVLLLAFMLASFPAHNSDVWRHLATGRALLTGTYTFGADPFAYTTDDATWVNHAWLQDLLLYAAYQVVGPYVVIIKALLVVALAGLMLLAARPAAPLDRVVLHRARTGRAWALPHVGTRHRLLYAVRVYPLVARPERGTTAVDRPLWGHWPLFLVLLLWANCDEWFMLGPGTVGMFWLGTMMPRSTGQPAQPGQSRNLFAIFAVSLAIGVLNPHHLRVFMLPAALDGSPDAAASLVQTLRMQSVAAMPPPLAAYLLLVGFGLVSFVTGVAPDPGRSRWSGLRCWR